MKIKKYNESSYYDSEFEKYTKFISDRFEMKNRPFGEVYLNFIEDNEISITIRIGGEIDPKYLASIINYFEDSDGVIYSPLNGEFLYYKLRLTFEFLKKLDIEMGANKYNL